MTYDVGTHIDLSYLNKKRGVVTSVPHKSVFEAAFTDNQTDGYEIGTAFRFSKTAQGIQAARRIPVTFA